MIQGKLFVVQNYKTERGIDIPKGSILNQVRLEFLEATGFSPSYHEELLTNALNAEKEGSTYFEWEGYLDKIPKNYTI